MDIHYRADEIFARHEELFGPSGMQRLRELGHDLLEVRSGGAMVYGADGKAWIDCMSNAGTHNLGRRHPAVVAAMKKAIYEADQGNFPMISMEKAYLAAKLGAFVPGKLECVVFSVVRGETVDFACKLARGHTGRKEILGFDGAWHGQTGFAMSLSQRHDGDAYGNLVPGLRALKYGDMEQLIKAVGRSTAAVIIEPVQAENGCRVADTAMLAELRKLCDRAGAVLIFDETQSGMGRTGRKFYYEHAGIEPDVLVVGEALGAGMFPIAATVFTGKLNRFMNRHPMIHLSTFGGTDVGCRVALGALEVYEQAKPWVNAGFMGEKLMEGMNYIAGLYPKKISQARGKGLLLSMDTGSPKQANSLCAAMAKRGVLVSPGEVARHSVVFRPGLLIGDAEVKTILDALGESVREL
ncbi:MAG TPA: aspartate aminotransferase family protein [Spirochaetes bacterium]|nr:aspartate aminotransferase family protein [Spirochaetota bacterium]